MDRITDVYSTYSVYNSVIVLHDDESSAVAAELLLNDFPLHMFEGGDMEEIARDMSDRKIRIVVVPCSRAPEFFRDADERMRKHISHVFFVDMDEKTDFRGWEVGWENTELMHICT